MKGINFVYNEIRRKQEDEEYHYQLKITQQKDSDQYEANKNALEKELRETRERVESELAIREKMVEENEQQFHALEIEVAQFPSKSEEAIAIAKSATEEQVKRELHFQMELSKKEIEGEKKLYQQKIEALETKIKEQENQISNMNTSTQQAGQQVKDIAVKAIEGASMRSNYSGLGDSVKNKTHE